MIIRSQDKKSITTDLNLYIYEDDWTHQFEVSNNIGMELGLYSTEEKAIKVLDMIQDAYTQYAAIKDGLGAVHGAFNIPKCFHMPQDSEV